MKKLSINTYKIGFIGLGKMGMPMAKNLLKAKFNLKAFDLNEKVKYDFNKFGGTVATNIKDVFIDSNIVITMLPNGKIVDNVLFGKEKNILNSPIGSLIIDMSSSDPNGTKFLGKKLSKAGYNLVDAPVSGGVKRAINKNIAIIIGGNEQNKNIAKKILNNLGSSVFDVGTLGSAHAMKAINNYVSSAGLVAACEALIIGEKFGIKSNIIIDVLNSSTGRNNSTETKMKEFILSKKFSSGFDMSLMSKDLSTALQISKHLNLDLKGVINASKLWKEAINSKSFTSSDHTEIYKYILKKSKK